jgi:site-specific DNA recombinase
MSEVAQKDAVVYARVSSKEQKKEGFSIPAQLKLLKDYAASHGFAVAKEYADVETAKQTGRAAFGEMIGYLKEHPAIRVILGRHFVRRSYSNRPGLCPPPTAASK